MKTIIMIVALAFSFMPSGRNANTKLVRDISYYWFDTSGNYIRQNTLLHESEVTGYSANTDNPKTLREKGFDPSNCSGWPPVPFDFSLPDAVLYSHP